MKSFVKKSLCTAFAVATAMPLFFTPTSSTVFATNDVVIDVSSNKQLIRGYGGMTHAGWAGDLTAEQRDTAFGNGDNQLGFSVLRIPIDNNKNNWYKEVETAKKAIEHGAIVFASPWNPPSEMTETYTLEMPQGTPTTLEAETNTTLNDAIVDSTNSGYTGTGYVSFQNETGSDVQWNRIQIGKTGNKNISIRYALASGTRSLDVYVNGEKVLSDVSFEATGSWDTWKEKSIQVSMVNGLSTLKLQTTGTGGPIIDNISLTKFVQDTEARRLRYDKYDDYAQYLNEFDTYMKDNGVDLYAISIQNEPDSAHDWTWWTPEEILRFMKENAGSINTKVMAPESYNYVKEYSDVILNDPEALANMDILGTHTYGTGYGDFPYPLFEQKGTGKELWMTEIYHPNSETDSADRWPEALDVAEHMYNAMVEGNFQAYVWWYIRREYSPIKEDGTISKRGYSMAHYSKFIRPGYERVEATKKPASGVFVSAYKGDNKVVIVALNKNDTEVSQHFALQNGTASTVSSWITDGTRSLEEGAPISASGDGFTTTLPPQSVITFVIEQ